MTRKRRWEIWKTHLSERLDDVFSVFVVHEYRHRKGAELADAIWGCQLSRFLCSRRVEMSQQGRGNKRGFIIVALLHLHSADGERMRTARERDRGQ